MSRYALILLLLLACPLMADDTLWVDLDANSYTSGLLPSTTGDSSYCDGNALHHISSATFGGDAFGCWLSTGAANGQSFYTIDSNDLSTIGNNDSIVEVFLPLKYYKQTGVPSVEVGINFSVTSGIADSTSWSFTAEGSPGEYISVIIPVDTLWDGSAITRAHLTGEATGQFQIGIQGDGGFSTQRFYLYEVADLLETHDGQMGIVYVAAPEPSSTSARRRNIITGRGGQ